MEKVIQISLSGHPGVLRSSEDGFNALSVYLERARLGLKNDPDQEEVLRDLEQSIGEKLQARLQSAEQILELRDVQAVLAEVGPVDTGGSEPPPAPASRSNRRLVRIREGQDIFGVCMGLAAYADIGVDWVRFIFIALTAVTGGIFLLVYLGLGFALPVVATRAAYEAEFN